MKSKYVMGIIAIAVALTLLSVGFVSAEGENGTGVPGSVEVPVDASTSVYGGIAWWENEFYGKKGWSTEIYTLTVVTEQTWFNIRIQDCCWYGDFYELWEVSPDIQFIGTTPEVETDAHHGSAAYPCKVGDPKHTGTGSVLSDGTFTVVKEIGVYKYRVRDPVFDKLAAEGYDPSDPMNPWSPAGFTIWFHFTTPAPELPIAVPLIVSLMVIALVPIKRKIWKD